MNPYAVEGPALISFSGGRTSAYMLRRMLDAYGGALPADVHAVFANTGKERTETLDFVLACSLRWGVRVHWIEYDPAGGYREVDVATASRAGEPFNALITKRKFLPNPVMRFCTQELKIRPMKAWMLARGYDTWASVIGFRHDEPKRVAKAEANTRERWIPTFPLYYGGATEADVLAYWAASPFDLQLQAHEGNCDVCFLKGIRKRVMILRARPDLGAWWAEQEERIGGTFRDDSPSYRFLLQQQALPFDWNDPLLDAATSFDDCACTD
jgi:3'-phosphoadenosine 5'-phosphosulfate sulfotransferase (PAPS reductase)/FAD synthetase